MPISTGLACGVTPQAALLGGICEVIERDAMSVYWYNRLSAPRIAVSGLADPGLAERLVRLHAAHLQPHFFDITTEIGVPSVLLVVLAEHGGWPAVTVTTATHPNPLSAMVKTIDEAVSTRNFAITRVGEGVIPPEIVIPRDVRELEDHLMAYARPTNVHHLDFLLKGTRTTTVEQMRAIDEATVDGQLDHVLERLHKEGMEAYAVDITTEDVAALNIVPLSNLEWVECRVKCGRKPGEANT